MFDLDIMGSYKVEKGVFKHGKTPLNVRGVFLLLTGFPLTL